MKVNYKIKTTVAAVFSVFAMSGAASAADVLGDSWGTISYGVPSGYIIPDTGGSGHTYNNAKSHYQSFHAPNGDGISNFPLDGKWFPEINRVAVDHGGTFVASQGGPRAHGVGDNWSIHYSHEGPNDCTIISKSGKLATERCDARHSCRQ